MRDYPDTLLRGVVAFDFFCVKTLLLRTPCVLFVIEIGSRRLHVLGVTRNPDSAWVTQQAGTWWWGIGLPGSGF